jgi:hypothetical protein
MEPVCVFGPYEGTQTGRHRPQAPHDLARPPAVLLNAHTSRDRGLVYIESTAVWVESFHGHAPCSGTAVPLRAPRKRVTVRCAKAVSRIKLIGGLKAPIGLAASDRCASSQHTRSYPRFPMPLCRTRDMRTHRELTLKRFVGEIGIALYPTKE